MAPITGLTIVKRFTYRGDPLEEFSNTYWFKQAPPANTAAWDTLLAAAATAEQLILPAQVHIVRAYGYNDDADNAVAVYSKDYTIPGPPPPGSFTPSGGTAFAGDQAACIEWKLDRLSAKGKPVYLRKYMHAGYAAAGTPDNLDGAYTTALNTYAGTGTSGIQHVGGGLRSRTHNDNVTVARVIPYVTTRTLKRRGKRPLP